MIINQMNGEIINTRQVHIHDDVLLSFVFDRDSKQLTLSCKRNAYYNHVHNQIYNMVFTKIIGFSMTACDFWGKSECILDFEYVIPPERVLIPQLQTRGKSQTDAFSCDDYIEILITFSSGDLLRIACASILLPDDLSLDK